MSAEKKYRRGWRNNYREAMPQTEALTKDIAFALKDFFRWLGNGFKLPVIICYPDFPSRKTTIYKITERLQVRLTNKGVKNPSVVICFDDSTVSNYEDVKKLFPSVKILNASCTDISKKKVDAIHGEVFGYSTSINPKNFIGIAVKKSDANAKHDGEKIQCPVSVTDDACIYQILLDNSADANFVVDYRLPVVGNNIPLIYFKFKKTELRFTNEVMRTELHRAENVFSADELKNIVSFTKKMGADFCELDIIRHKGDGLIYIIDLNKTPYGPPKGLSKAENKKAVELLSTAFLEEFLS